MSDHITFHLSRYAPAGYPDFRKDITLYNQIKQGIKPVEYRYIKNGWDDYWIKRLFNPLPYSFKVHVEDLGLASLGCYVKSDVLRYKKAWFVEGYPRNTLPHLETDITGVWIWCHKLSRKLEWLHINFTNVKEVCFPVINSKEQQK
jgi:hypothetical protein